MLAPRKLSLTDAWGSGVEVRVSCCAQFRDGVARHSASPSDIRSTLHAAGIRTARQAWKRVRFQLRQRTGRAEMGSKIGREPQHTCQCVNTSVSPRRVLRRARAPRTQSLSHPRVGLRPLVAHPLAWTCFFKGTGIRQTSWSYLYTPERSVHTSNYDRSRKRIKQLNEASGLAKLHEHGGALASAAF
jgi:hypothetical protein